MKRSSYKPKYPVQTLEKSMDVLMYMVNSANVNGNTITEISQGTGIGKSGVHRILDTFLSYRIVEKIPATQSYRLGWGLYELGISVPSTNNLLSTDYSDVMSELCQDVSETVNLAIRSDNNIVIIDRKEPKSYLHVSSVIGALQPLHATGLGKIYLSEMSDQDVMDFYSSHEMELPTKNTIATAEAMTAELAKVRKTGYAFDRCEFEPDLICVAMPIRDCNGRLAAAMSVSGYKLHMTNDKLQQVIPRLRSATSKISASLGYRSDLM